MKLLFRGAALPLLAGMLVGFPDSGLSETVEDRTFSAGGFDFVRPERWQQVKPKSSMRKAQLQIPGKRQNGEIVFFHFGSGTAGGTQANIDRWLRQFQEPVSQLNAQTEKTKLKDGTPVTLVRAEGTFLSGPPAGAKTPMPDYGLYGAILESSSSGYVFVKFTAPREVVSSETKNFRDMIVAARREASAED